MAEEDAMTTPEIRSENLPGSRTDGSDLLILFDVFLGFGVLAVVGGLLWAWLGRWALSGPTGLVVALVGWPVLGCVLILLSVALARRDAIYAHVPVRSGQKLRDLARSLFAKSISAGLLSAIAYLMYRALWAN
jgi:hypothetical protein